MTNASRVLPGFSCLCVLSFGLYAGTGENCIVLWCWRAHKTVSLRKIFLDHFVSCICILVVFIWCLWCLPRFRFNVKTCGILCEYPINLSLFLSNIPAFLSYNGIRNAQVVGSSPTTSSMFYPLFRMEGRVFCTFSAFRSISARHSAALRVPASYIQRETDLVTYARSVSLCLLFVLFSVPKMRPSV